MEVNERQKLKIEETENLYNMVYEYCKARNYKNSLNALPFAREAYAGKYRKGEDKAPYFIHPLRVTNWAMTLGGLDKRMEDIALATYILHDVKEENKSCDLYNLKVLDIIIKYVDILSFTRSGVRSKIEDQEIYYNEIIKYLITAYGKAIDRCDVLSTMAIDFPKHKVADYFVETSRFYPEIFLKLRSEPSLKQQTWFLENFMRNHIQSIEGAWRSYEEEDNLLRERKIS